MAEKSNISWTHHTASPWFGCTEVSPGCVNCYARELTLQHKWSGWGDKSPRVRSKGFWKDVYKWDKKAEGASEHPRIFTSLMDWLDPMVPIEWLADFLEVVRCCDNLDWLLLTKRPELWQPRMAMVCEHLESAGYPFALKYWIRDWCGGTPPVNVWFGVTVEDQTRADERVPLLMRIPAKIRWLSVEPLLETVDLWGARYSNPKGGQTGAITSWGYGMDWVVVGGESGAKRRDCGIKAIIDVVETCQSGNVPVWVKQDCAMRPGQQGRLPTEIFNLKQIPR